MNSDWLQQLAPGHAPSPPGWWPPAPGWWAVGLLCILVAAGFTWWVRDPRRALRRTALRQLHLIRASDADGAAVARGIQNLLRRYALTVFGPEQVAKLTGESWLRFVIAHGGATLTGASGRSLLSAAFGNNVADEREQWSAGAEGFIRRARREARVEKKRDDRPKTQSSGSAGGSPRAKDTAAIGDSLSVSHERAEGKR